MVAEVAGTVSELRCSPPRLLPDLLRLTLLSLGSEGVSTLRGQFNPAGSGMAHAGAERRASTANYAAPRAKNMLLNWVGGLLATAALIR